MLRQAARQLRVAAPLAAALPPPHRYMVQPHTPLHQLQQARGIGGDDVSRKVFTAMPSALAVGPLYRCLLLLRLRLLPSSCSLSSLLPPSPPLSSSYRYPPHLPLRLLLLLLPSSSSSYLLSPPTHPPPPPPHPCPDCAHPRPSGPHSARRRPRPAPRPWRRWCYPPYRQLARAHLPPSPVALPLLVVGVTLGYSDASPDWLLIVPPVPPRLASLRCGHLEVLQWAHLNVVHICNVSSGFSFSFAS